MDKKNNQEFIEKLNQEIKKLKDKAFNVYFFVLDSKGNPSGELTYIYQTALQLTEMGYCVTMLHQEENFVGVGDWLGDKYAALPHKNVQKENVAMSAADILVIPEIYANVMSQVKNLPCKKVALFHNEPYLTATIPVGVTWADMHIYDAVTTTRENEKLLNDYFPYINTWVVSPSISEVFRPAKEPQSLLINVLSKEQEDIDKIIKPFYWKFPVYQWVSFRDLRGLPQETLADALRDGAITIWLDDKTSFGYTLLESLKCGSIVLAKIPDNPTDWMLKEDGTLIDGPIWFNNVRDLPEMVASVVRTWMMDEIPEEVYTDSASFKDAYTYDKQSIEVKKAYVDGIFEKHIKELENAITIAKKEINE